MIQTYTNHKYIIRGTFSLAENALGDPSLVSVSIGSNTTIQCYDPDNGIGYGGDNNARMWTISGSNFAMQDTGRYNIYLRLSRTVGTARLFPTKYYYAVNGKRTDADGNVLVMTEQAEQDGETIEIDTNTEDQSNFYIYIGFISSVIDGRREATIDLGRYSTDKGQQETLLTAVQSELGKLKVEFLQLVEDVKEWVVGHFLNLDTEERQDIKGPIAIGATDEGMLDGKGTLIRPDGSMQLDRLEVRKSMTVTELIMNRVHAMDGDWYFSDSGTIEEVTPVEGSTNSYKLLLRKQSDKDVLNFKAGDIIFTKLNDFFEGLSEGVVYDDCWMRVNRVNNQEFSLVVTMIEGSAPRAGYTIVRRGNQTDAQRQQSWNLSSSEGRITFYGDVDSSQLQNHNTKLVLGKLPSTGVMAPFAGEVGLYAQTLLAERLRQVNYEGKVVYEYIDCGEWDAATAAAGGYVYERETRKDEAGETWTVIRQSRVYYLGFQWQCQQNGATGAPRWDNVQWALLSGGQDGDYTVDIESTNGEAFYLDRIDTTLVAHLFFNGTDITMEALGEHNGSISWKWERYDANDDVWTDLRRNTNELHIDDSILPESWYTEYYAMYRVTATIAIAGRETKTAGFTATLNI